VSIPFVLNDTPVLYCGKEIDVTSQLRNGENYLLINTTNIPSDVLVSIEWRNCDSPEDLVDKIIKNYDPYVLMPNDQYISDICPMSNKQIQKPGRGLKCAHAQCFDLVTFIKAAQKTGNWNCPICGITLSLELLRHDPSFLKNCGTLFIGEDTLDEY
jgi:hypothetical protein